MAFVGKYSALVVVAVCATALIAGLGVSPAFAQQTLPPQAQAIVNSVSPQQLQAACAKGVDGVKALVMAKVGDVPPQEKRNVAPHGPAMTQALMAKCPH